GRAEPFEDEPLAPRHAPRAVLRVGGERVRQRRGEGGGLVQREAGRGAAEVVPGGRLRTEDSGTPLGHVEVELEDAVLGEEALEAARDDELLRLAQERPLRREVEVLGELLRDRAAPADLVP